ncbi:MAG TPA: phage major capsid protein [Coriobacteriia bacterium]
MDSRVVQLNAAGAALNEAVEAIRTAAEDADLAPLEATFRTAKAEFERCQGNADIAGVAAGVKRFVPTPIDNPNDLGMDSEGVRGRKSIAEQAFGSRAAFKGIGAGFRAAITLPSQRAITIPSYPGVVDLNIPAFPDYPRGFADTLIQAPTDGAVTFLRRGAHTGSAAQWASGEKAASAYAWEEATAPLTWIAHHTPIAKTEASNWGQLQAIIEGEMMIGLQQAKSVAALVGTNSAGIVGVTNTEGCQLYTVDTAADADGNIDNVYDSIRRMATKVFLASGFRPTHVAMSPQVKEELDLLKGEDGHYLVISVGTQVWGLKIVEDCGLTVVTTAGSAPVVTTTHNGVIVYASVGATWYTKETDNVEIGLVDDQFINNAFTLLAEGRNALAVKYPDAFCYCDDAIPAVAV